jgi:hypothetical protein
MGDLERIESFLGEIRRDDRSSPDGKHWHQFYQLLSRHASDGRQPPMPHILAASGESNDAKFTRLREQLLWASEQRCLDEALSFLANLDPVHWNSVVGGDWARDSYWR